MSDTNSLKKDSKTAIQDSAAENQPIAKGSGEVNEPENDSGDDKGVQESFPVKESTSTSQMDLEEADDVGEDNLGEGDEDEDEDVGSTDDKSEGLKLPVVSALVLKKIKPTLSEKFRPGDVCTVIQQVMREVIVDKVYVAADVQGWIKDMTKMINERVKELNFQRYKLITYVAIGEIRGQGAVAATKCVWDEESDYTSSFTYRNNSLFCVVSVHGVYYY